jgi:Fe-S-cluster containining protein
MNDMVRMAGGHKMRLSELAAYALKVTRQRTERRVRAVRGAGLTVSCSKGCSACCRQVVPVSAPEAWMLADLVARMPDELRLEVLSRFRSAAQTLQDNGMGKAPLLSEAVRYFRLGIPCPFLNADACGIYPYWPVVCHEYMVTSPAYMCSDPQAHSISIMPVRVRVSECLAEVAAQLLDLGKTMIPLVRALEWAALHEAEGNLTWPADYLKRLLESRIAANET